MKSNWLSYILHLTSCASRVQQQISMTTGPKIIAQGLFYLLIELWIAIVSLPLYAFVAPAEFAQGETNPNAIKQYRLRRVVSLSVLGGVVLIIIIFIATSVFGVIIFPSKSSASEASWDFNNPIAYNYDTSKIQIVSGTVIFKAELNPLASPAVLQTVETTTTTTTDTTTSTSETIIPATDTTTTTDTEVQTTTPDTTTTTPEPIAPTPEPSAPEPSPEPTPEPTVPSAPSGGSLLFLTPKTVFAEEETAVCSATLTPIAPMIVTPLVSWTGFSEIANKQNGDIAYQLSTDGGLTWLYFDGDSWTGANGNWNTADTIDAYISDLPIGVAVGGTGTLSFKAKFTNDCQTDISLLSLTAEYEDTQSTIGSNILGSSTNDAPTTTVTSTESDPAVINLTNTLDTQIPSQTVEIPVIIPDTTIIDATPTTIETPTIATDTTTDLGTTTTTQTPGVTETITNPTSGTELVSAGTTTDTNLTTTITPSVGVPIPFSIHIAIRATGSPHTLYSIPGIFTLAETDNGLQASVTGTDLQPTPFSSGANVSVGDHIVVIVYDGEFMKIYVDGAITSSANVPIVIAPPTTVSTSIGCVSAGFVLDALSAAQVNANYLECGNHAPTLSIIDAGQMTDDSFIDIGYTASDQENNFISLSTYEYSLTSNFSDAQNMTEALVDTNHSGTLGLTALSTGSSHEFVWNIKNDLPNYAGNVYVRLAADDGLATGTPATVGPIAVDTQDSTPSNQINEITVDTSTATTPEDIITVVGSTTISNIIADIFGGGTIEPTIPSVDTNVVVTSPVADINVSVGTSDTAVAVTTPTDTTAPTENTTSGSSPNSSSGSSSSRGNQNQNSPSNFTTGAVTSSVGPTSATPAFTQTALNDLSDAKQSAIVATPIIGNVKKSVAGSTIAFSGRGIPNSKVALFIHSDQVVVYTTDADKHGDWQFTHDQKNVELAPGEHSIFAVTYDPGSKIKSKPSLVETFDVKRNQASVILAYTNIPTTILTVLALALAAGYMVFRKKEAK